MIAARRVAALIVLILAGCGGVDESSKTSQPVQTPVTFTPPPKPKSGDACSTPDGSGVCASDAAALICQSGIFKPFQCRGPGGCIADATHFLCDGTRSVAGDACTKENESKAQCDAADANKALVCTNGIWQSRVCTGCYTSGGQILCH